MREYGTAWRRAGCFGVSFISLSDRSSNLFTETEPQINGLTLADPKAIKHVLHSAGYHYPKSAERAQVNKLFAGNGLVASQGLHSFDWFFDCNI